MRGTGSRPVRGVLRPSFERTVRRPPERHHAVLRLVRLHVHRTRGLLFHALPLLVTGIVPAPADPLQPGRENAPGPLTSLAIQPSSGTGAERSGTLNEQPPVAV